MAIEANQLPTPSNDIPPDQITADEGGQEQPSSGVELKPAVNKLERDESEDRSEVTTWKDDKRNEINARAREQRKQTTAPYSGAPSDPNALYGTESDKSELGALEQEALRRQQEAARQALEDVTGESVPPIETQQPAPAPRKTLNDLDPNFLATPVRAIVDGEERLITVEEAIRNYQINQAADNRLVTAQALLQQAKEFQKRQSQPAEPSGYSSEEQDAGQSDAPRRNTSAVDAKDLIEKIQLGSTEEAMTALDSFIDMKVRNVAPAGVDESTVLNVLENRNAREAITQFAAKNPEIVNDPIINDMIPKFSHREMVEDLLRTGLNMDQLREHVRSPQDLTAMHREARAKRVPGVRSVDQIMSSAYQRIQAWRTGGTPQPQPSPANQPRVNLQDRQERKAALPNQPTSRKLAPQPGKTAATQDESRQGAVARMRQARGQAV
jgi:hypothetical protein